MIYSIYPDADATIYEESPFKNTGLDSILQLTKTVPSSSQYNIDVSRILMKFDISGISQSIVDGDIASDSQFYLNLYTSEVSAMPLEYDIYAYPISQSWNMGVGRKNDSPKTVEGCSWTYRDGYSERTLWLSGSLTSNTTGSFDGGGTWYSGSGYESTQSFNFEKTDIRMNVTPIVNLWLSGSINNDGFMITRDPVDEQSRSEIGTINFFSRDTSTIYPPRLEIVWDDSSFDTGSLEPLTSINKILYFKNLKNEYNQDSIERLRVVGRELYPQKNYVTTGSQYYSVVEYLPSNSYYSLRDAHTEEIIIPFDTIGTKISCDSSGNYFDMRMAGLQPERYYRLIIKIENGTTTEYYDNKYLFKVMR